MAIAEREIEPQTQKQLYTEEEYFDVTMVCGPRQYCGGNLTVLPDPRRSGQIFARTDL